MGSFHDGELPAQNELIDGVGEKLAMSTTKPRAVAITLDDGQRVSGLLEAPESARACYVLAHGAGAGMEHPFMAAVVNPHVRHH